MRATIRREKPDIIVFSADLADPASVALVKEQLWSGAASVGLSDVADEEYLERLRSAGYVEIYPKPVSYPEVLAGLKRILERRRLQSLTGLIGESDAVREVMVQFEQMAPVTATVLVEGESGTGKELVARALHVLSGRKSRPFIAVNVGALPETLLESELFGHEKGAFTGAAERRLGRFELADRGSIFLDEIGEIPVGTQVKLLRVLEEREFMRVGGTSPINVDVRVIAATNRPLDVRHLGAGQNGDDVGRRRLIARLDRRRRTHAGESGVAPRALRIRRYTILAGRGGLYVANPAVTAPRVDVVDAFVVQPATHLLYLKFELDETPHDELQLAASSALFISEYRSDVHRQIPGATVSDLSGQILRLDLVPGREHDHALDEVPQLADVPRPGILAEDLHRLGAYPVKRAVVLF